MKFTGPTLPLVPVELLIVNQYQTPFYDGVFCNLPYEAFELLDSQDISNAVGVHSQAFTIVNDSRYDCRAVQEYGRGYSYLHLFHHRHIT